MYATDKAMPIDQGKTSTSQQPYNDKNIMFLERDLHTILLRYGVCPTDHDISLYQTAFVHRSYCKKKYESLIAGNIKCPEHVMQLKASSYERLEHLGDSVVGCIVASYLYDKYPGQDEGFLTRTKVKIVNGIAMSVFFKLLNISHFIIISSQIEASGGRDSAKIHEDVFESFIGALFIDLGFDSCKRWLINFYEENIDFADLILHNTNYKDTLIKQCQNERNYTPKFQEIAMNKTNGKFTVCVKDDRNSILAHGVGTSKKQAESAAAKSALIFMGVPLTYNLIN